MHQYKKILSCLVRKHMNLGASENNEGHVRQKLFDEDLGDSMNKNRRIAGSKPIYGQLQKKKVQEAFESNVQSLADWHLCLHFCESSPQLRPPGQSASV